MRYTNIMKRVFEKKNISSLVLFASIVFTIIIFSLLVYSVIRSGYSYAIDTDEFFHAQYAYLLGVGQRPYVDFYASVYTPLFAAVLLPIIKIFGTTMSTLFSIRAFMIVLFLLRVVITGTIVVKLFGKKVLALFLLLFFLDPFTVFVAMQIRPDNLMMLFFSSGVLYLLYAEEKRKPYLFFLAGLTFGLSLLTLIKILPGILCIFAVFAISCVVRKHKMPLVYLLEGFMLPILLFFLVSILQGSFGALVQQMIIDPAKTFSAFFYQIPLGNFYWYNNIYIFGAPGKPLSWIFAWLLLFLAMAGAHALSVALLQTKKFEFRDFIKLSLLLSLFVYQISFFFVNNLYIQYYLPVSYLYALLGAIAIHSVLSSSGTKKYVHRGLVLMLFFLALIFTYKSILLNISRSTMYDSEKMRAYEKRLVTIKQSETVFPGFVFRPLAFPMLYGYFMTPSEAALPLLYRYSPIEEYLEKEKTKFVILNDYTLKLLPVPAQEYIKTHYKNTNPSDEELLIRIQ